MSTINIKYESENMWIVGIGILFHMLFTIKYSIFSNVTIEFNLKYYSLAQ